MCFKLLYESNKKTEIPANFIPMAQIHDTGKQGEALAARFLEDAGCKILATNWRYKQYELDIVAQEKDTLLIVEVKTRESNFFGEPESFVTKTKQKQLIKAAAAFVEQNNLDLEVRFDIVSVIIGKDKQQLNHIPGAFYPTLR
ncbi:MAG: YraN family protein [Bacteroidia bacterium]